ncbi:hypothetical protein L873DRAFT_1805053, partial [Choiromyces venosus 120613-1]
MDQHNPQLTLSLGSRTSQSTSTLGTPPAVPPAAAPVVPLTTLPVTPLVAPTVMPSVTPLVTSLAAYSVAPLAASSVAPLATSSVAPLAASSVASLAAPPVVPLTAPQAVHPTAHPSHHKSTELQGSQGIALSNNLQRIESESSRQRASLNESERLQLVRLCCTRGEEYLQGKEKFWVCRTEEFNIATSKNIANARSIVMCMLKLYTARLSKDSRSSGIVFIESELDQALKAWNYWVERADENKLAKRQGGEEEKQEQEQAKLDRENMLLPMSKKRIFREAAAALSD